MDCYGICNRKTDYFHNDFKQIAIQKALARSSCHLLPRQSDQSVLNLHLPLSVNAAKMRPLRDGVPVDQPNKTL